jgi:hypothetical protein
MLKPMEQLCKIPEGVDTDISAEANQ